MFEIRQASSADIPVIEALARGIWPLCYPFLLTPEQIAAMLNELYSAERLADDMKLGHIFWITRLGDQDVGFIAAYMDDNGEIMWLKKLYIFPEFHGKRIGQALMSRAFQHFSQAPKAALNVNDKNHPAIAFYERLGFEITQRVAVVMGGFDYFDYIMVKGLQGAPHLL